MPLYFRYCGDCLSRSILSWNWVFCGAAEDCVADDGRFSLVPHRREEAFMSEQGLSVQSYDLPLAVIDAGHGGFCSPLLSLSLLNLVP